MPGISGTQKQKDVSAEGVESWAEGQKGNQLSTQIFSRHLFSVPARHLGAPFHDNSFSTNHLWTDRRL